MTSQFSKSLLLLFFLDCCATARCIPHFQVSKDPPNKSGFRLKSMLEPAVFQGAKCIKTTCSEDP